MQQQDASANHSHHRTHVTHAALASAVCIPTSTTHRMVICAQVASLHGSIRRGAAVLPPGHHDTRRAPRPSDEVMQELASVRTRSCSACEA